MRGHGNNREARCASHHLTDPGQRRLPAPAGRAQGAIRRGRYFAFFKPGHTEGIVPARIKELARLKIAALNECDT